MGEKYSASDRDEAIRSKMIAFQVCPVGSLMFGSDYPFNHIFGLKCAFSRASRRKPLVIMSVVPKVFFSSLEYALSISIEMD